MDRQYEFFLFDLDGTLVDTSPGIIQSLRHTEKEMGVAPLSDAEIQKFVGPPLRWSFQTFHGVSEEAADRMVRIYREYYEANGMKNGLVYPGVIQALEEIGRQGCRIGIATLKQERVAQQTLETFGLAEMIDEMAGNNDRTGLSKGEEIELLLRRFGAPDRSRAVMFGDSPYDGIGAMEARVDFVGLLYGFGFSAGGAAHDDFPSVKMLKKPLELPAFVRAHLAPRPAGR